MRETESEREREKEAKNEDDDDDGGYQSRPRGEFMFSRYRTMSRTSCPLSSGIHTVPCDKRHARTDAARPPLGKFWGEGTHAGNEHNACVFGSLELSALDYFALSFSNRRQAYIYLFHFKFKKCDLVHLKKNRTSCATKT